MILGREILTHPNNFQRGGCTASGSLPRTFLPGVEITRHVERVEANALRLRAWW